MQKRAKRSAGGFDVPPVKRVYVEPATLSASDSKLPLVESDLEMEEKPLGPKSKPDIAAPELITLSRHETERIARSCMSAYILNYKGIISNEAAWMAIFREAAQLHECIRKRPAIYSHMLYTRCLSDLRYEIRVIDDYESPVQVFLEMSTVRRSYMISDGPRVELLRKFATGYHVVRHPYLRTVIFHPRCM